ncbi:MAG TPA: leucyl/phenylalanyl-tRNA--protein transferase [Maribacter sp.]|uniref:leucyl/phenylalanyl-tRNA--protein transferase n=1 Tax=unclassified Maribacter TaxID=2615042 RepID=UPI000EF05895|nr:MULTISPECIES: leucyl/phenylalanyl-tRNA--protein transferase [unclassified Maribacter]HAF78565.1 leucyl/phenylalanyl-tRNA--protein transferase [Maribacter sp.]HAI38180.1 leucyl/phenylalanyl-tRNA--protein transferase [Maribacter sp.]|tara:strand:- start:43963 stop:44595 length:633 start_codon:yes stop_codon:yes gene_type:complete
MYFITDELVFPPVENANVEGLLAVGGDLSPERLLLAYQNGIFPWFDNDSIILWWSPDPRMVLFPNEIKVSKSMKKVIRNKQFRLTKNTCFERVLEYCSSVPREGQDGTWITEAMITAYIKLHKNGIAQSYEVWEEDKLVGGLYGVDLGHVFCGESMFSLTSNASKFAFIKLAEELSLNEYKVIDCQLHTDHLASMGAKEIARKDFMAILK